jgi:hypothetical protein
MDEYTRKRHICQLLGKTLLSITGGIQSDELVFHCTDGTSYKMYHEQNCCESVSIDDIVGDLTRLLHYPITVAEERSGDLAPCKDDWNESYTWTFYELATIKGSVTIRWYGSSNGYYSESVSVKQINT